MKAKSTKRVQVECPAKINLTFEILGTLPEGYHEVRTLLQTISLCDRLIFTFSEGSGAIEYERYRAGVPGHFPEDESNLLSKAIRKYQSRVSDANQYDIAISIEKSIPIGAGLAGGSANAAAALLAMNDFFDGALSPGQLLELGGTLGADVPFSIRGGTCLGTGKGDLLSEVKTTFSRDVLLIKPRDLHVSTPWAFKQFDLYHAGSSQAGTTSDITSKVIALLGEENANWQFLHNDLEAIVFRQYPGLARIRQYIEAAGAPACRLTGSGPTLIAIIEEGSDAEKFKNQIERSCSTQFSCDEEIAEILPLDFYAVRPVRQGARIINQTP